MGKVGKFLFVSGAGLLSFSAVCLMKSGDPYLAIQGTILVLFALGVVLVLGGETIRALGHFRESKDEPRWRHFIQAHKPNLKPKTGGRPLQDSRCFFCGKDDGSSSSSRRGERTESTALTFGRCLNCGRTVCPRCAYLKGMEMGRKSLRCPGCGGQVY
jgi:hypothetical protein